MFTLMPVYMYVCYSVRELYLNDKTHTFIFIPTESYVLSSIAGIYCHTYRTAALFRNLKWKTAPRKTRYMQLDCRA
jgi:hypothetical protein